MTKFDFIIPICNMENDGFDERLNNLMIIVSRLSKKETHLILVEQVLNDESPKYLNHIFIPEDLDCTKIFIKNPVFNKSWCYNVGIRNSKYSKLLLSEMDVTINLKYFDILNKFLDKNPNFNWFFAWNQLLYWDQFNQKTEDERVPEKGMAEGGIIFCQKDFYWKN